MITEVRGVEFLVSETWCGDGIGIVSEGRGVKIFKRYIPSVVKSLRDGSELDVVARIFNRIARFRSKVRVRDDVGGSLTIPAKSVPVFIVAIESRYRGER